MPPVSADSNNLGSGADSFDTDSPCNRPPRPEHIHSNALVPVQRMSDTYYPHDAESLSPDTPYLASAPRTGPGTGYDTHLVHTLVPSPDAAAHYSGIGRTHTPFRHTHSHAPSR